MKQIKITEFLSTLMLIVLALSFSTCKNESPPVRIGMCLWPGYEFLYLADQKGFFRDEGLNVQLYDFVSLSDSRRAFERGQIDVVAGTIVELLIIRESSNKFPQAFYVTDFSNGADVILGKKPISTIHELKGKRVGVEPASMDLLTINLALKQNQMVLTDVVLVPMAQNGMENSFEKNQVDAICTYPPISVKVLNKGDANILFNSSLIPGYIVDVLMADEAFINERNEDLVKVIRAINKAIQFASENPAEALPVIADHEQISVGDLQVAYEGMIVEPVDNQLQYFSPGGQLFNAGETALEVLMETGVIRKDIDVNKIINSQPVTSAVKNLKKDE